MNVLSATNLLLSRLSIDAIIQLLPQEDSLRRRRFDTSWVSIRVEGVTDADAPAGLSRAERAAQRPRASHPGVARERGGRPAAIALPSHALRRVRGGIDPWAKP